MRTKHGHFSQDEVNLRCWKLADFVEALFIFRTRARLLRVTTAKMKGLFKGTVDRLTTSSCKKIVSIVQVLPGHFVDVKVKPK